MSFEPYLLRIFALSATFLTIQQAALAQLPPTDQCGPANGQFEPSQGDEFILSERSDTCPTGSNPGAQCSSPLTNSEELEDGIAKWANACEDYGTRFPETTINIGADVSPPETIGLSLEIIKGQRIVDRIPRTPGDFAPETKAVEVAPNEFRFVMTGGKIRIWTRDEHDNPTDISETLAHELGHAYGLFHPSPVNMQQCSTARRIMAQRPEFGGRSVKQRDCNQANRRWLTNDPDDVSDPVPEPMDPTQQPFPPEIDPCELDPQQQGCSNGPSGILIWDWCTGSGGGGTTPTERTFCFFLFGQFFCVTTVIGGRGLPGTSLVPYTEDFWDCTTGSAVSTPVAGSTLPTGGFGPKIVFINPAEREVLSGHAAVGVSVSHAALGGEPIGFFVDTVQVILGGYSENVEVTGLCDTPSISDPACPFIGFAGTLDTNTLADGLHVFQVLAIDHRWPAPRLTWAEQEFVVNNQNPPPPPPPAMPAITVHQQWDSQIMPNGGLFDFATRPLAQLPLVAPFLVCNGGNASLAIANLSSIVTGQGFAKGPGPHPPIAPGNCSQLPVRFQAVAPGTYQGAVTIESNDPSYPTYSFALAGEVEGITDTIAPRLFIGRPLTNESISGTFEARGWALDATLLTTSSFSFEIDGLPASLSGFAYGSNRQGACDANADLNSPNCPNVGWEGMLDSTTLANGAHSITLRGTDSSGNVRLRTIPFAVNNPVVPPSIWVFDMNGDNSWDDPPDRVLAIDTMAGQPVVGDWNGDGIDGVGTFSNGVWRIDWNENDSWDGCTVDRCVPFGLVGDTPVVGDWNGDGRDEIGIVRNGTWALDMNASFDWEGEPEDAYFSFGTASAVPVVGDWNGDGTDDVGTYQSGFWHLDFDGDNLWEDCLNDKCFAFGLADDRPVTGDWNGNGSDSVGVVRGAHWGLDTNGSFDWEGPPIDAEFDFGFVSDYPISGSWTASGKDHIGLFRAQ